MANWVNLEEDQSYRLKDFAPGKNEKDYVKVPVPIVFDKDQVVQRVCMFKKNNACLIVKLVFSGQVPPIYILKSKEDEIWA